MTEQSRSLSTSEAIEQGIAFAQRGDLRSAETMFRGVLMIEPENFEAIERLGSGPMNRCSPCSGSRAHYCNCW
jgi:hypothetical protein